jgi:ribosomal protein L31
MSFGKYSAETCVVELQICACHPTFTGSSGACKSRFGEVTLMYT